MTQGQNKKLLYVGGLAEEVDEKMLHAAFIPFGDIIGEFEVLQYLLPVLRKTRHKVYRLKNDLIYI